MKALPQLLSCLLLTCVASLNSGAAWSDTESKPSVVKTPTQAMHKPHRKHKRCRKEADLAQALPAASVSVAKASPYLDSSVKIASAPNPNVVPAAIVPAAPLTLTKSLSLLPIAAASVPAVAKSNVATAPVPVTKLSMVSIPVPIAVATMPAVAKANLASTLALAAPTRAEIHAPASVAAVVPVTLAVPHASAPALNPYLANSVAFNQATSPAFKVNSPALNVSGDLEQLFGDIRRALPSMPPLADESILPTVKKVYPTGDKPLYVLTFKCPTELVGIVPPPTKVLHWLVSSGMDAINSSNLLPFNMQQVCQ